MTKIDNSINTFILATIIKICLTDLSSYQNETEKPTKHLQVIYQWPAGYHETITDINYF